MGAIIICLCSIILGISAGEVQMSGDDMDGLIATLSGRMTSSWILYVSLSCSEANCHVMRPPLGERGHIRRTLRST